ncbi:hypothetical protein Csa_020821 [Cucumis sativus]|nr:hypothetical protein Csa_020821 [Cucumis sativus]
MKLIPVEYLIRNTVDSKPESGARSVVNEIRVHSEWFGRVQEVNMDLRVQEIGSSIKESSVQWLFFSLLYILCAPCSLISCASQLILDLASPYVWSSGLESFGRAQEILPLRGSPIQPCHLSLYRFALLSNLTKHTWTSRDNEMKSFLNDETKEEIY